MDWTVVLEPHEENPDPQGRNMSGLIVYLEDRAADDPGGTRKEHSSVTYTRRHSKNPRVRFKDQLKAQIEEAVTAAEALNTSAAAVAAAKRAHDEAHASVSGTKAA